MDVLLGLFSLSGVVVGFGEGVCIANALALVTIAKPNVAAVKVHSLDSGSWGGPPDQEFAGFAESGSTQNVTSTLRPLQDCKERSAYRRT